jgi:hypothetical protein
MKKQGGKCMIALVVLLAAQGTLGNLEAANWDCATPLIQKNYRQSFSAVALARRIADECSSPFVPFAAIPNDSAQHVSSLRSLEETYYLSSKDIFERQVQGEIESMRVRDAIKLRR